MTQTERDAIASLLEEALDKIAMERYSSAESLINRALYWAYGPDDELGDDDYDELDFENER